VPPLSLNSTKCERVVCFRAATIRRSEPMTERSATLDRGRWRAGLCGIGCPQVVAVDAANSGGFRNSRTAASAWATRLCRRSGRSVSSWEALAGAAGRKRLTATARLTPPLGFTPMGDTGDDGVVVRWPCSSPAAPVPRAGSAVRKDEAGGLVLAARPGPGLSRRSGRGRRNQLISFETAPVWTLSTPAVVYDATVKYQVPAASPSIDVLVMAGLAMFRVCVSEPADVP